MLSNFVLKVVFMGSSLFHKLLLDDSNEDEIIKEVVMNSTSRKCCSNIKRNYLAGHERFYLDYFANSPIYLEKEFQSRFRMSRSLFFNIISKVEAHDPYFVQKRNGGKKLGYLPFKRSLLHSIRMFAYGVTSDFMDGYVLGKVNIVVIFVSRLLFWKQWHHMIFGYGMYFLGYLDQIMILIC